MRISIPIKCILTIGLYMMRLCIHALQKICMIICGTIILSIIFVFVSKLTFKIFFVIIQFIIQFLNSIKIIFELIIFKFQIFIFKFHTIKSLIFQVFHFTL